MFNDIELFPKTVSEVKSRNYVDTSMDFAGSKIDVPIIAAPMPDVVNKQSLQQICKHAYGFSHRFQPLIDQMNDIAELNKNFGCAIPLKQYHMSVDMFAANGIKSFLIDTANGANRQVEEVVKYIKNTVPSAYITTGNVVSAECVRWLKDIGVYAVRLFIGAGMVCTTKNEAGIYRDPVKCLKECCRVEGILKIADGGISEPSHMIKAIALGADAIMMGGQFARCIDSAAHKNSDGTRVYRGAASKEIAAGKSEYIEGQQSNLAPSGTINEMLIRYRNGLRSGMSYMNCTNLEDFRGILTAGDPKHDLENLYDVSPIPNYSD